MRPLAAGPDPHLRSPRRGLRRRQRLPSQRQEAALIRDLENPDQEGANLPAGTWHVAIYPASSWHKPAFSANLPLAAGTAYFAYAVGSPANGTFTVLPQAIAIQ